MNVILIIMAVVVAVVGVIMFAALFVKKQFSIRREIIIRLPVEKVFDYVRRLKNQDYYSKWVMADPAMKKGFRGEDGTVGFVYAWDGNKQAGKGEQEIVAIKENSLVDIQVRFEKPFKSIARTPITTEQINENDTRVTCGMEGESNFPLNLMNHVMAGVLGKDLELSLRNLKSNLERKNP